MTPSSPALRWRRRLLERAARRCGFVFGLTWTGDLHAQAVADAVRVAGDICFRSSGLTCGFELTMPVGPDTGFVCAAASLLVPMPPDQGRHLARFARSIEASNSRAIGVTVLSDAISGRIVLRSHIVLRGCEGGEEPSTELQHVLTDAIVDMARNLLPVGEDWWMTCAHLKDGDTHEPAGPPQGRIPEGAARRYSSERWR